MVQVKRMSACLILLLFFTRVHAQQFPLANAFAHNDYWHKRPLFDALENGYRNIEVDIYARRSRLVVSHFLPMFGKKRTLESLYLKPILARVKGDSSSMQTNHPAQIVLMIDIKSKANRTYRKLAPLLEQYKSILTHFEDGKLTEGQVTIVLSGHKPYQMLMHDKSHVAFLDEDLKKLSRDTTVRDMSPMASCKYKSLLKWKGEGAMPAADKKRLCYYVQMAHAFGQKVRLWASPEKKAVWKELLGCGVDLICTDKLNALSTFLVSAVPDAKE